jgi:hypothetical protein
VASLFFHLEMQNSFVLVLRFWVLW